LADDLGQRKQVMEAAAGDGKGDRCRCGHRLAFRLADPIPGGSL
jgi:hypothetical protein